MKDLYYAYDKTIKKVVPHTLKGFTLISLVTGTEQKYKPSCDYYIEKVKRKCASKKQLGDYCILHFRKLKELALNETT